MIGTVFRSDDVPAEHRFDYWRELVHRAIAPSDIHSEFAGDFWAQQRLLELGPVLVWPTAHLPTGFRRTEKMVRQSDPEMYHLSAGARRRLRAGVRGADRDVRPE